MADVSSQRRDAHAGLVLPSKSPRASVSASQPAIRFIYRGPADGLGGAFGVQLPTQPCRAHTSGHRAALWLGPDEWLLIVPEDASGSLATQLRSARLTGGCLVDVSHRNAGIVIRGTKAAEILNAACPLDLDETAFPVGMCTRTLFGKAEFVLWRTGSDTFHLETWRSFLPYVVGLLTVAIRDLA